MKRHSIHLLRWLPLALAAAGCGGDVMPVSDDAAVIQGDAAMDALIDSDAAPAADDLGVPGDLATITDLTIVVPDDFTAPPDFACPGKLGCACAPPGGCDPGLVCDELAMICRAPIDCMSGPCAPHQLCTPKAGADAVCEMACDPDYRFDQLAGNCQACVSIGCKAEPCDPNNAMFAQCIAGNRGCDFTMANVTCGGCLNGFVLDVNMKCVPAPDCGGAICKVTEYCDTSKAMPACVARPCAKATDAATSHNPNPVCKDCSALVCKGAGLTGRAWPYTSNNQDCMCETTSGYFLPIGTTTTAYACDGDNDGWVRNDGAEAKYGVDAEYAANARCAVNEITKVTLQDEYGIASDFVWCGGTEIAPIGKCSGGGSAQRMHLIEPARNDVPRGPSADSPTYGARQLRPEELTWLTKACVTAAGDYDGDAQSDYLETQTATLPAGPGIPKWTAEQAALHQFSYFVELYVGRFEATAPNLGRLRIRERSRCDITFPLHYDPAKSANPAAPTDNPYYVGGMITPNPNAAGSEYWRNCQRNRDPLYKADPKLTGYDFARFACGQVAGACPVLPPAHPTIDVSKYDPKTAATEIRGHGVCNLGVDNLGARRTPKDGLWRGLMHHSQFKCVAVVANQPATDLSEKSLTDFQQNGAPWQLNRCGAVICDPKGTPCQRGTGGDLANFDPNIQCSALDPAKVNVGALGWAVRKYPPGGGNYAGGCMNEDASWTFVDDSKATQSLLCPYPIYFSSIAASNQQAAYQTRVDNSFGRYSCFGDSKNFLWAPATNPAWAQLCLDSACPGATEIGVLR